MNKKISIILILIFCLSSIYVSIIPETKASDSLIATYPLSNRDDGGQIWGHYPTDGSLTEPARYETFTATSTKYVTSIVLQFESIGMDIARDGLTIGSFVVRLFNCDNNLNHVPTDEIEVSTNSFTYFELINTTYLTKTFTFSGTHQLISGNVYAFVVTCALDNSEESHASIRVGEDLSAPSYTGYCSTWRTTPTNAWMTPSSAVDICFELYGSDTMATPTPPPQPSGSCGVNFFVNYNGTPTNNYTPYGNITWTILQNGSPSLTYVVGNIGSTTYFNDGLALNIKAQIEQGWYFQNYTKVNSDGTLNYPIDTWAITLDSTKGIWNITLLISQTPNNVNVTLNNGLHGKIYYQLIVSGSVQNGATGDVISGSDTTKYGAGTYQVNRYATLHIGVVPDTGYNISYYDVYANGVSQKVTAFPLTVIAESNMTITAYYQEVSTIGVIGDSNGFFNFLLSFTWQQIAVLVIYIAITALCTYLFAFTGLIAGIDIATVICFITGLLGNLMYPVLGLVVLVNIALIIVGSGLLNRRKNGTDA